jgi:tripartite-type tricarboxylate transporter receptor subunit TctC
VDVVARLIQEPLSKLIGQTVIIDYKPGAAGNIASEYVARAKPDGYTLVFGTAATHGTNAALYPKLPFDVEKDFEAVAPVVDVSNVLTINPDVIKVNSLAEFVKEVKANPGKYNFASTGNGTGTHMAFAELNWRLGPGHGACALQGRSGSHHLGAARRDLLHHEPGADRAAALQERQAQAAGRHHRQADCGRAGSAARGRQRSARHQGF